MFVLNALTWGGLELLRDRGCRTIFPGGVTDLHFCTGTAFRFVATGAGGAGIVRFCRDFVVLADIFGFGCAVYATSLYSSASEILTLQ